MGLFYRDGRGTPRNAIDSYAWLIVSGLRSPAEERWLIASAVQELASTMTTDEIASARARARELVRTLPARKLQEPQESREH